MLKVLLEQCYTLHSQLIALAAIFDHHATICYSIPHWPHDTCHVSVCSAFQGSETGSRCSIKVLDFESGGFQDLTNSPTKALYIHDTHYVHHELHHRFSQRTSRRFATGFPNAGKPYSGLPNCLRARRASECVLRSHVMQCSVRITFMTA